MCLHSDVMYIFLAAAPDSDLWTCFQKNCMLKDLHVLVSDGEDVKITLFKCCRWRTRNATPLLMDYRDNS